ncbi:MAG: two-component regulator propeller domain-containing protein, partial [Bacteroides sp.]
MPFKYFFLFIFLLISIPISSKETSYYFKQISLEEGLSQATVTSILYDSKGFLWIGSKAGLNRYDSYELKVYKNTKS